LATDATFQPPMGWLKAVAEKNVPVKSKQLATFQLARFWSNAEVSQNVAYMFDTDATFQLLMSALNVVFLRKSSAMLVTTAVFQSAMLPYVVVAVLGLVNHAVTAVPMFVFVMAVSACAQGRMRCAISATAAKRRQPLGSR
jgi:hypothetical protein